MSSTLRARLAPMRRGLIGLGAVSLAAASFWLVPRPVGAIVQEPGLRAIVVDASASVVRRRPGWLPWIRGEVAREARAAEAAGQHTALIVCAEGVDVRMPAGSAGELLARLEGRAGAPLDPSAAADGASAVAQAMEVARGLVVDPRRPAGEVVLFTDGVFGATDRAGADATVGRLAAAGTEVRVVMTPEPKLGDAALVEILVPTRVELGAPLVARCVLDLAPPLADELAIVLDLTTSAGLRTEITSVDTGAGGRVVVDVDLGPAGPGRTEIQGRLLHAGGDPIPENDRARASVVAEGELILGAVASPSARPDLEAWLLRGGASVFPGVQVVPLTPEGLPAAIEDLDALVTFDLPLDALSDELVTAFVRSGGGWLVVSGWTFLGDWSRDTRVNHSSLHPLLPLRPAAIDGGPRDVVVLVDGSGSMAGEPFDLVRTAAIEMVAAALPRDEIELRFFTQGLGRRHVLRRRSLDGAVDRTESREEAARALFEARVPGGSTWILSCLEQLVLEREARDREALVLLLTDGREAGTYPEPEAKAAGLVERFRAARADLRVVAVGRQADLAFLDRLVAPGEALVRADELSELSSIFQREVNRERTEDDAPIPVRRAPNGGPLADQLLAGDDAMPPLERLVLDEAREGATVLWETDEGAPVLGAWRVGLGRTAVFASTPEVGWAPEWIGESERFGALLRWLCRGREHGGPHAEIVVGTDGLEVVVEGLPEGAPPRIAARLMDPSGGEETALTLDLAPRHGADLGRDRRSARLSGSGWNPAGGTAILALEPFAPRGDEPGTAGSEAIALPVSLPRAPEFASAAPRDRAAWEHEGGLPPTAAGLATAGERVSPLGPALAAIGLGLVFLGAAFARR